MIERIAEKEGVSCNGVDWNALADDTGYDPDGHPGYTYGLWDEDHHMMQLNPNSLDNPNDLINTVAHEMRHAQQYEAAHDVDAPWQPSSQAPRTVDPFADERAHGITEDQAHTWKDDFDHYKDFGPGHDSEADFQAYHDQPVETDARKAGQEYVNGLTDAEFENMLEESR